MRKKIINLKIKGVLEYRKHPAGDASVDMVPRSRRAITNTKFLPTEISFHFESVGNQLIFNQYFYFIVCSTGTLIPS